jgi:hypothetical protein
MATLEDGFYTIIKGSSDLAATNPSVDPGSDVLLLPPGAAEAASQRVGSLLCSYSRIRFYDILFPPPVGGQEDTKGNLYDN